VLCVSGDAAVVRGFAKSGQVKILSPGDQLSDAGLDVVEGVGERGELLDGILLPLVRRGPVLHRWHRCRFGCSLVDVEYGDELVDADGFVVGGAGVGLPGREVECGLSGRIGRGSCPHWLIGGTAAQPAFCRRSVSERGGGGGCPRSPRRRPSAASPRLEGEVGVEGSAPPHQRVRPTQHRIHRRVDNVQRAVVVGNGG